MRLRNSYRERLESERNFERLAQAIDFLFDKPVLTIRHLEQGIGLSNYVIAQRLIEKLEQYGILQEITGKARNRVYQADEILRTIDSPLEV